ncbi:MAG: DUF2793 domain-containing protein [Alphaproteobacteria bacterium]|nr:DUF2793 domain-containing protein [Alphaproteobacteria bacterium]
MTTSPNLSMPYLVASQAQKEVTHNEALADLDCLAQLCAVSRALTTPPASPSEGDAYIVADSPTGAWAGQAGRVAIYFSGWRFKTPKAGWIAFVQNESKFVVYNGSAWDLMGGYVS